MIKSYELNGPEAIFLGYEDLHDPAFDQYERTTALELYETTVEGLCAHTVRDAYSERHLISSVAVSSRLFVFHSCMFTRQRNFGRPTPRTALQSTQALFLRLFSLLESCSLSTK
jgi:hypothetical protein